jgi:predicted MFS family arabinose efflux permease
VLTGGFAIAAVGLGWLVLTPGGDSYAADLLPGLLISGFGHGVIYTSMFIIGTRDVPAEHQGAAGSLLTTSQYLSGAVTVAILTLVLDGHGFRWAFAVTALAALAGVVLALARGTAREIVVPARQHVSHGS